MSVAPRRPAGRGCVRHRRAIWWYSAGTRDLACLIAAVAVLLSMPAAAGATQPDPASSRTPAGPFQESTRVAKVARIQQLEGAPHTVFLGSSRAMRVDPKYYLSVTGRTAFNAAVSSGSIVDAYCYANLIRERFPGTTQHYVWFLDVEQFRQKTINRTIFAQPELARFVPSGFPSPYAGQSLTPAPAPAPAPPQPWGKVDVIDPDGWLRWNRYDYWRPRGRTLKKGLAYSRWKYKSIYPRGFARLYGLPRWFMRETLTLMDSWGSYPVVVLMPYHPSLHAYISKRGYTKRYRQVWSYLKKLQRDGLDFALLNMSQIQRFRGWKTGFYDGVHMRTTMSNVLLRRTMTLTGDLLK